MYVDGRRGPVALRGYEGEVYVVTEQGAVALHDVPVLQRRVAALCHHSLCSGVSPEAGLPERDVLVAEPSGAVVVITCPGRELPDDHPALLSQVLEECGRTVTRSHPADAWEVD